MEIHNKSLKKAYRSTAKKIEGIEYDILEEKI